MLRSYFSCCQENTLLKNVSYLLLSLQILDRQIQQQESRIGCQYSTLGDGNCDDANNNADCDYDRGDCYERQVRKCSECECLDQFCSKCECLDPGYE